MCWRGHPDHFMRYYPKKGGGVNRTCLLCVNAVRNHRIEKMKYYKMIRGGFQGMPMLDICVASNVSERSIHRWRSGKPAKEVNAIKVADGTGFLFDNIWEAIS